MMILNKISCLFGNHQWEYDSKTSNTIIYTRNLHGTFGSTIIEYTRFCHICSKKQFQRSTIKPIYANNGKWKTTNNLTKEELRHKTLKSLGL